MTHIETPLFAVGERFSVPMHEIAHPDDISIFGTHFGENTYYSDYAGIARKYAPRHVLEIGVRYGYSGIALCLGAIAAGVEAPIYHGCDAEYFAGPDGYRNYRSNAVAAENFRRFVPGVEAHLHSMNTVAHGLPPEVLVQQFDLVNVDGDHSYAGCLKDLRQTWPLLAPTGVVIVDDTGMADVKRAILVFLDEVDEAVHYMWHSNERGFFILKRGGID